LRVLANIVMPGIADKSGKIINHCTLLVAMDTKYRADQVETANAGVISAKATLEDAVENFARNKKLYLFATAILVYVLYSLKASEQPTTSLWGVPFSVWLYYRLPGSF